MKLRTRIAYAAIGLASLAALAACDRTVAATAAAPLTGAPPAASAAPSAASAAPTNGQAPEVIVESGQPSAPPSPNVAKTQGRVSVYSGPPDTVLHPSPDTGKGSNIVQLDSTNNDEIGVYVADGQGMTLYRFDKDSATPPKSNCAGDCAKTWPPLLIASPGQIYPSGVDPQLVGYVERADGTCQVTIDGQPVYHYSGDQKPGDIKGQGVGGTWFAITPSGARTKNSIEVVPLPSSSGH
ncbi:hypothetical protein GCM10023322_51820 [Rugosimonospora acidiphila]|uniref:Lipoprotein n=1 Tax=Rugosimonospora acidiphila TaxID=556531 RepID=A0ABP9S8C4_9ACTN